MARQFKPARLFVMKGVAAFVGSEDWVDRYFDTRAPVVTR
jgi:hypothetical protein